MAIIKNLVWCSLHIEGFRGVTECCIRTTLITNIGVCLVKSQNKISISTVYDAALLFCWRNLSKNGMISKSCSVR